MSQFELFPAAALDLSADRKLAELKPPLLSLGASSFTFRGWNNIVYAGNRTQAQLVSEGLGEYARHPLFSTVSIDRGFYQPMTAAEFEGYARQLPTGFRCGVKVWNALTTPNDFKTGKPNDSFLSNQVFNHSILDVVKSTFLPHLGPLIFQFPSFANCRWLTPQVFQAKLARFFSSLPPAFDYAVELREPQFLTQAHLEVLRHHQVAHVFNHWEAMPSIADQLKLKNTFTGKCVVSRVLLPQGRGYDEQREAFSPFDKLVEIDDVMREQVCRLIELAITEQKPIYVFVGNKAEGSSPLTIRGLLSKLASRPLPLKAQQIEQAPSK